MIKAHLDLFDVEDHGENHIPAVIGAVRRVYGIAGEPDLVHLRREVTEGALAVQEVFGVAPRWYRGAAAVYDAQAAEEIGRLGLGIAGFSVNVDAGATLGKGAIIERLKQVRDGDVLIAHMNKPASASAEGLAVGLVALLHRGFVFVRLDAVTLQVVPPRPSRRPASVCAIAQPPASGAGTICGRRPPVCMNVRRRMPCTTNGVIHAAESFRLVVHAAADCHLLD